MKILYAKSTILVTSLLLALFVLFGASSESRISLITCEGDFVAAEDTYDQRRVVEAKLIFDTAAPGQLSQI